MMFLLRTAFWIGVVLALLPTFGPKQSAPPAAAFGATEAVTAASATFGDMIGFCNRQPDACAAGCFGNAPRVQQMPERVQPVQIHPA